MFVGFGFSAVFPVLHGVYMYGVEQMQQSIGLYWVILQGSLYILGAALYAVRCQSRRSCMACTGWSADSLKV